jgi:hypothetical protein
MEAFTAALTTWFDGHSDVSQRALALTAGLPGPDLSKFRAGKRPITLDALTKLLPAIERLSTRSHARALLVAYLHDETPAPYQPDIRIYAVDEDTGTLDRDDITNARERWERKARADAEFAKMWLTLDGYMHEPSATAVDARLADIALLAEPVTEYKATKKPRTGPSHPQDTIRHDAMPSQHAAQEHQEP